jgi:hypothetical protein
VNIMHAESESILCKITGTAVSMPRSTVNSIVIAEMTVVMSVGIKEMTIKTMVTTVAAITR